MFLNNIKSLLPKQYSFAESINLTHIVASINIFKSLFQPRIAQPVIVKRPLKKRTVNVYQLIAIAGAVLFICSCQKEKLNDTVLNSTTSSSSAEARVTFHRQHKDLVSTYGAFIGTPDSVKDLDYQLNVGDQLGISCLRERVLVPANSLSLNLVPELNTSYKVMLNFCTPKNPDGTLLPFISDFAQYTIDLNDILNTFTVMPVMAVIENEESNRFYYSGTAREYLNQLSTAIGVMHDRKIKVANGGITSTGLCYLVYEDLLAQGKEDSAEQFKQLVNVTPNSPFTQDRGAFIDTLLNAYTQMDLDYVNFHWKATSPDTQAFNQVINYLKNRTGKNVISNEIGQFDEDPNTLQSHVQECTDQNFAYIMWYSPNEADGKKDTPLHHSDASLTPTGFAYQDFLAN